MGEVYALPNPNLRLYLVRQKLGSDAVIRTTFARGQDAQSVLDEWAPSLSGVERNWPTLMEFENDLRAKVGPLSVMKPLRDRLPALDAYYDDVTLESVPLEKQAVDRTCDEWSRMRGLRPRTEESTLQSMKLSTNSGAPYFTKRRLVLDKLVPYKIERVSDDMWVQHLPEFSGYLVATLGWRGQEGGPTAADVKQRILWMFPFAANVSELSTYQPLIQGAQKLNLVPAWNGNEFVDRAITQLFDTKGRNDLIVCTDFSRFDQHMNGDMQRAAYDVLSYLGSGNDALNQWLVNIFPIKYGIPINYEWGQFKTGAHGMASGSGGTNADETLAHRVLQHEAALMAGAVLNKHSMCLGDDGILTYPGITVDHVVRTYTRHGQVMNVDKQYASPEDCTYLRRWHHRDYRVDGICVGVYSTYRALGKLMYMERYIDPKKWGPKAVAMRQLSIIENCNYHPEFERFVEFCMTKDKYRLGIDLPGFIAGINSTYQQAMADETLYLSYSAQFSPVPPGQWKVVQLLKRMK